MKHSYRSRLRVTFLVFATAAVFLTGAEAAVRAREARVDAREETLQALAATWQVGVERTLQTTHRHAASLVSDLAVTASAQPASALHPRASVDAAVAATFERVRVTFGYADIVFIGADGHTVHADGRTDGDGAIGDALRALATQARRLPGARSPRNIVATIASGVVVGAVRGDEGGDGGDGGVVLIALSTDNLAPPQAPDGVRLSVVDERGAVLAGVPFASGADVLRAVQPLSVDGRSWSVVVEQDRRALLSPIHALERRLILIGLFIAGLFAVVGWWLARMVTRPVLALASVAEDLGKQGVSDADVDAALADARAVCADDEVGALADALRQMVLDLRETTVSRDALDAAHGELRQLTTRLLHAQEDERARIARELHDDIVQRLASLAIDIARVKKLDDDDNRTAALEALHGRLAVLSEDVHGLSRRLHPSRLEDLGLDTAVVAECRGFFERGGPPVDLDVRGAWADVPAPTRLAVFRVVQESLRNIARHARADHVSVRLHRQDDRVVVDVVDDGCGFSRDAVAFRPGLGLSSMAERMRLLGGELHVVSTPGAGTTIHAEVRA
jgi:signal transduction histidine kinase